MDNNNSSNQTTRQRLAMWLRITLLITVVVGLMGAILTLPNRALAEGSATDNQAILVFDWDQPVTRGMGGFAQYKPLSSYPRFPNGNWLSPIDYTKGTLWFRAKVKSIPVNQPGMKLGFCFWQQKPKTGEECTKNFAATGVPGADTRWSQTFKSMTKIHGKAITWSQPRWKAGFVVRNSRGKPVSPKLNMNWSGENPAKWYPLDIKYTVVWTPGPQPDWTKFGWPTK